MALRLLRGAAAGAGAGQVRGQGPERDGGHLPGDRPLSAGGGRHRGLVHAAGLAHRKPPPDRLPEAGREVVTVLVTEVKLSLDSVINVAQKTLVVASDPFNSLLCAGCY